jgi:hypothetical protein
MPVLSWKRSEMNLLEETKSITYNKYVDSFRIFPIMTDIENNDGYKEE